MAGQDRPQGIDCERGFHAALVAHAPIESEGSVEIDFICPACGAIEYTTSWTKAAWLQEQAKLLAAAAKRDQR